MMRADFDSEANALSIDLIEFDLYERQESVHDTYCQVAFAKGMPANVELLNPATNWISSSLSRNATTWTPLRFVQRR